MTTYRPGQRVRSRGVYPKDAPDHVPAGMEGVIIGVGTWFNYVKFDDLSEEAVTEDWEIEPVETRKERIIRQVRETGRPFVARVARSDRTSVTPRWALILSDGHAYPFYGYQANEVMDIARRDTSGYTPYVNWDLA